MEKYFNLFHLSSILLFLSISSSLISRSYSYSDALDHERQIYIVYMGARRGGEYTPSSHHLSMLQEVVDESFVSKSLVRSYTRSFNGFAAYLNEQESQKLASFDEVVSVFPSETLKPQTTRSWDFMGFPQNVLRNPKVESNVIIGVIDTGIWPESPSFNDEGLSPVPAKWNGECKGGKNFTCNKKLIGAQFYNARGLKNVSARDTDGHGTHTASTAAGSNVKGASFYGFGDGTARGGAPGARIAAYKVCYGEAGCHTSDILAAFDDAVADGVDIISVSLGGLFFNTLTRDVVSIGSFHAMERGILTVHAGGNSGLDGFPTTSVAPWLLSVAANTIDRQFIDTVVLGNGKTLVGHAVNSFKLKGKEVALVSGSDATSNCTGYLARGCYPGCLNKNITRGKIVVCDDNGGMFEAYASGALGSIVATQGNATDIFSVVPFPAAALSTRDLNSVYAYINATKSPKAYISRSEEVGVADAPVVASFSSRGPNGLLPEILKPDLTAPGVGILAAYSPAASPSMDAQDTRATNYNILSGTSMACPHVTGAAAYVKSFYPHWSPSAIKSALMTTARRMNATKHPHAEFSYGAGHIDPIAATHPGLVYETTKEDYAVMVCSLGYDPSEIQKLFDGQVSCPKNVKSTPKDLNYPSMAVYINRTTPFIVKFPRNVTNVGRANSTYKATITGNSSLKITVNPKILRFESLHEKKAFVVTVIGKKLKSKMASASLLWSDGRHSVRSPIVVYRYMYPPVA